MKPSSAISGVQVDPKLKRQYYQDSKYILSLIQKLELQCISKFDKRMGSTLNLNISAIQSKETQNNNHVQSSKIGPSGAHNYFCFNLSLIIESYLEYQYTPV